MTSFSHYNYITNMENPPSLGLKVAIIEGSIPHPYCITGASVQLVWIVGSCSQTTKQSRKEANSACEVVVGDSTETLLQIKSLWCHEYD